MFRYFTKNLSKKCILFQHNGQVSIDTETEVVALIHFHIFSSGILVSLRTEKQVNDKHMTCQLYHWPKTPFRKRPMWTMFTQPWDCQKKGCLWLCKVLFCFVLQLQTAGVFWKRWSFFRKFQLSCLSFSSSDPLHMSGSLEVVWLQSLATYFVSEELP